MHLLLQNPGLGLLVGILGFAFIGYGLVQVASGRSFRDQSPKSKRATVLLALAQWPYLFVLAYSLMQLIGKTQ